MTLRDELLTWSRSSWPEAGDPAAKVESSPDPIARKWLAAIFRVRCRVEPGWIFDACLRWPGEVIALGPVAGKVCGYGQDEFPPAGDDWRATVLSYLYFERAAFGQVLSSEADRLALQYESEILAAIARNHEPARPAEVNPSPAPVEPVPVVRQETFSSMFK